jgi:GDP/UDP-N,N'-diacetylbacillosamine 2-epimerase (hydrolysing)
VKKICVVTGTRAEYGLLRWVMAGIQRSARLELQLVVTGAHLSPDFGLTYRAIEADGFAIDRRVEMLLSSDSAVGVTKSMALGLSGFGDALSDLRPDLLLLLGDRYEILAAAAAALLARVPIAHLHGGETTEGAIDEAIRHAVTKMSHLHFVATPEYARRVIQLGEQPGHVFVVGGLGIDSIVKLELLQRAALESAIDFAFGKRNLLVTFHPVTLEHDGAASQMAELLAAIDALPETHVIFTMPNADHEGRTLSGMIESFVAGHQERCTYVPSLGQVRYLSAVAQVDAVVGNSSSGLTEVPTLKKPTINIGDRQRGRTRAASVIDCPPERRAIQDAIARACSPAFQASLKTVVNPYGTGGASDAIVETLERTDLTGILKKRFHDLDA